MRRRRKREVTTIEMRFNNVPVLPVQQLYRLFKFEPALNEWLILEENYETDTAPDGVTHFLYTDRVRLAMALPPQTHIRTIRDLLKQLPPPHRQVPQSELDTKG